MDEATAIATPGCAECVRLREQVEQLQAIVAKLLDRQNTHSGNSSIPPSANPPHAPKPQAKPRSKRKRGGQPGHRGHHRERISHDRLTRVEDHIPTTCSHCRTPLSTEPSPGDPEPTWHQVLDLPPIVLEVTEHRGHARICESCGETTREPIPGSVIAHVAGARLTGFLSYLVARQQVSRRGCQELLTVLGGALSLGTIVALEAEVAEALATPHAAAGQQTREAAAKNGDETGWKQAGARRWLWTVATATVAYFVIHARRGLEGLQAAVGGVVKGVMTSDRWSAYRSWPLERRQICWAHLVRDFTKCQDRGGVFEPLGTAGRAIAKELFAAWNSWRDRTIDRPELKRRLAPLRARLRGELEQARASPNPKLKTFATNLLNLEPALWLFADHDGLEPTNNHAERVLRRGVLWRKLAFGSVSDQGTRFAERMLTVVQTLRLQNRPVLDYLTEAVRAHRQGEPAPKLVP